MLIEKDLSKYIILSHTPISVLVEKIVENKDRTVLVVNEAKILLGVITEGDLIRAYVRGNTLHTIAVDIMTTNYKSILDYPNRKEQEAQAREIFKEYAVPLIPIIDVNKKLLSVISLRNYIRHIIL